MNSSLYTVSQENATDPNLLKQHQFSPSQQSPATVKQVTGNYGGRRWRALDQFSAANSQTENNLFDEWLHSLVARSINTMFFDYLTIQTFI